jgi:hypothetical protein
MKMSLRPCASASLLGGLAIGASLMYLLDPHRGISRREHLRTHLFSRLRKVGEEIDGRIRDVRKRVLAMPLHRVAQLSLVPHQPVPDWVIAERTRLETWCTLAHPDSVNISVRNGRVTLWGPVLADEPERLHARLLKIPGLRHLELQLTTREEAITRIA